MIPLADLNSMIQNWLKKAQDESNDFEVRMALYDCIDDLQLLIANFLEEEIKAQEDYTNYMINEGLFKLEDVA